MYCFLAHSGMNAISNGKITPCCAIARYTPEEKNSKSLSEKLNHINLIRVRAQLKADIWPSECSSCKQAEQIKTESLRTMFNQYASSRGVDDTMHTTLDPKDVYSVHISVGSKCNSKCMTCNPGSSSLWQDEWKTIWNMKEMISTSDPIIEDPKLVNELITEFTSIKKITFLGGEPTINSNHLDYLNLLIANNRSRDIDLGYVTNLTGIDDSLLDVWSNFRKIDLNISLDAYGEKNDYIRYPIKWTKVESNLRKFLDWASEDKISIGLSLTPSAFNCIHLDEVYQYWYGLLVEYNLPMTYGVALNKITYPMHTSMRITSLEYRKQGIDKLVKLKETIAPEFFNSIDYAIQMLNEPVLDTDTINTGKHFIEQSDMYRNKHVKEAIPELYNELWQK